MLSALGVSTCGDLHARRGLAAALFSAVALDFFVSATLGLGALAHVGPCSQPAQPCVLGQRRSLEPAVCCNRPGRVCVGLGSVYQEAVGWVHSDV